MGLHDTLEKVLSLYESMTGSAERAEAAAAQMEEYNRRVADMVSSAEVRQRGREQGLDYAYDRLERRIDEHASEGSRWMFLLQLLVVGFFAALFAGAARSLVEWSLEAISRWWTG